MLVLGWGPERGRHRGESRRAGGMGGRSEVMGVAGGRWLLTSNRPFLA